MHCLVNKNIGYWMLLDVIKIVSSGRLVGVSKKSPLGKTPAGRICPSLSAKVIFSWQKSELSKETLGRSQEVVTHSYLYKSCHNLMRSIAETRILLSRILSQPTLVLRNILLYVDMIILNDCASKHVENWHQLEKIPWNQKPWHHEMAKTSGSKIPLFSRVTMDPIRWSPFVKLQVNRQNWFIPTRVVHKMLHDRLPLKLREITYKIILHHCLPL